MRLAVGAIIRWHTDRTTPPKRKRFLCVCPDRGWFLMLNSRDLWGESVLMHAADANGALDRDSYAELGALIAPPLGRVASQLLNGDAEVLGVVGRATLRRLLDAVNDADTLIDDERTIVLDAISAALAGIDV